MVYRIYRFNPKLCVSASKLSGCIEKQKSKVVIAMPTSGEIVQLNEKILISGFNCINTRLGFDSEILMAQTIVAKTVKKWL